MKYDVVIVGGGIAGLIAAAYLSRAGYNILLCEKESKCGGLINSFERDGFIYDGGIRALENSGILFPMMADLDLDVEMVRNHVSLGIEDRVIRIDSEENIDDYQSVLLALYPESQQDILAILSNIREIMHYMDVQYGIKNPIFLDLKKDREYMLKEIVPWMFKYIATVGKITAMNEPVEDYLQRFTTNQHLLDIISQHFFRRTPAFFALSYLKIYLDYNYPVGGTGKFIEAIQKLIEKHHGHIQTSTKIIGLDAEQRQLTTEHGQVYTYRRLIWAADQQSLYRLAKETSFRSKKVRKAVNEHAQLLSGKQGNDSIFTLYAAVDRPPDYFASIASEHFFYTPDRRGQSGAGTLPYGETREEVERWLLSYFALTTYEIAIPVLRDANLAPAGKTGLIISVLFDYKLTRQIQDAGWYSEFKLLCENQILTILGQSIYPGIQYDIIHRFSSTPLTMEALTGNHEGAITGWSFSNIPLPAENRLPKVMNAVRTSIPGVYQAGQWTYSPSGLPISILTGKIAADRVLKDLGFKDLTRRG